MAGLIDDLELLVTVIPKLVNELELAASVYHQAIADDLALEVDISPLLTDDLLLQVSIINQALKTAGEAALLAPQAEVTFL